MADSEANPAVQSLLDQYRVAVIEYHKYGTKILLLLKGRSIGDLDPEDVEVYQEAITRRETAYGKMQRLEAQIPNTGPDTFRVFSTPIDARSRQAKPLNERHSPLATIHDGRAEEGSGCSELSKLDQHKVALNRYREWDEKIKQLLKGRSVGDLDPETREAYRQASTNREAAYDEVRSLEKQLLDAIPAPGTAQAPRRGFIRFAPPDATHGGAHFLRIVDKKTGRQIEVDGVEANVTVAEFVAAYRQRVHTPEAATLAFIRTSTGEELECGPVTFAEAGIGDNEMLLAVVKLSPFHKLRADVRAALKNNNLVLIVVAIIGAIATIVAAIIALVQK